MYLSWSNRIWIPCDDKHSPFVAPPDPHLFVKVRRLQPSSHITPCRLFQDTENPPQFQRRSNVEIDRQFLEANHSPVGNRFASPERTLDGDGTEILLHLIRHGSLRNVERLLRDASRRVHRDARGADGTLRTELRHLDRAALAHVHRFPQFRVVRLIAVVVLGSSVGAPQSLHRAGGRVLQVPRPVQLGRLVRVRQQSVGGRRRLLQRPDEAQDPDLRFRRRRLAVLGAGDGG
mmetsp:Transcript_5530/g.11501  ORF Transcript_5530/g.11501 Transcript_5530/m.11501 type:complete len:233 (+) Transcript_5530:190-888(+)